MMSTTLNNKVAAWQEPVTEAPGATRQRVLEVACNLFAEVGFHGTHLREVCKRAKANVAGICYHFGSKEGLYTAVLEEAIQRLANAWNQIRDFPDNAPPEERLRSLVQSLFARLGGGRTWIAKLLTRELLDSVSAPPGSGGVALERDFVFLHAVIRELLDADADRETIRLHALSILWECVFFSVAASNQERLAGGLMGSLPAGSSLARHVAERSLSALGNERIYRGEPHLT